MQLPKDATLLRIFIGENGRFEGHPLYEAIVLKARELHMAGATVLRGPMGFGRTSRLHTTKVLRLSDDLPIVVEIVDSQQQIDQVSADPRDHDRLGPGDPRKGPGHSLWRRRWRLISSKPRRPIRDMR